MSERDPTPTSPEAPSGQSPSPDVVSFVLRFVREASDEQEARWRGTIRHVQGSSERSFKQFSEALGFMQAQLNDLVETTVKTAVKTTVETAVETAVESSDRLARSNPWIETAKLWGEFVPQVNRLMLERVSEAVQKAPVLGWGAGREARLQARLEALTSQLSSLSATLADLQAELAALRSGQPEAESSQLESSRAKSKASDDA